MSHNHTVCFVSKCMLNSNVQTEMMESSSKTKFVIDTCYNHVNKLIFLNEPLLELFLNECRKEFHIKCKSANIRLTTKTGAPIAQNRFSDVLEAAGSYCFIHLWILNKESDSSIVTPNDIKEYLIERNEETILSESELGILTEKSRRKLIRLITNYQTERFGPNATPAQRQAIATATGFVFKTLSTSVIKGFCSIRSTNQRAASKRKLDTENHLSAKVIRSDDECAADLEVLKTIVISPETMAEIKEKLVATMNYRLKLVDKMEVDLLETYPYFFADPTLISFDFAQRFPNANENAFIELWPDLRMSLNRVLTQQYKLHIQTLWSKEIQDLLILLKLVHAKAGRNTAPLSILAFNKSIEKFIVFRETNCPLQQLREPRNNHPYIIACGTSCEEITHFYIDLESHLMSVPHGYDIAQTFDLFLKCHESIGLHFEPNIKPMAHFCLHFFYRVKKMNRISPYLKNLYDSLNVSQA